MQDEKEYIPISALRHWIFCPRQCAINHMEQTWIENVFTAEGRLLHDKADRGTTEVRGDTKVCTSLWLRSDALGLVGQADVVEFHRKGEVWIPFPVEYKRGRKNADNRDRVQLCAQALCLEEMLGTPVPAGALFYGKTRRREQVALDADLRQQTATIVHEIRNMLKSCVTPPAIADARCEHCSLNDACMPCAPVSRDHSGRYLAALCKSGEEP